MVVISLEALEESPDSNVRFCLAGPGACPGRKADIHDERSQPSDGPLFEAWGLPLRGKSSLFLGLCAVTG